MDETFPTHPNFKSAVPNFTSANDIDECIGRALHHQNKCKFRRATTPWEMNEWDYNELQAFEVHVQEIDRLYHIKSEEPDGCWYELIARLEKKNKEHFYVDLKAKCSFSGFLSEGSGLIYISKDINIFMQTVVEPELKESIYDFLIKDGMLCQETDYDKLMEAKDAYDNIWF